MAGRTISPLFDLIQQGDNVHRIAFASLAETSAQRPTTPGAYPPAGAGPRQPLVRATSGQGAAALLVQAGGPAEPPVSAGRRGTGGRNKLFHLCHDKEDNCPPLRFKEKQVHPTKAYLASLMAKILSLKNSRSRKP